ncbi:MAG: serine hydrolase domain-containing protein [Pseudomonadota bacterium]
MRKNGLRILLSITALLLSTQCYCGCSKSRSFPQTIENTSRFIDQTMAQNNMVGLSIALVSEGWTVWAAGFGWADKENRVPARADTAYMLGSGSKTLTTVALLQLAEQGLVSLDRPAVDYLAGFQLAARYPGQMQGITVKRLLNHHSGLPGDIYNGGFVELAWNQWGCSLYTDWLMNYLSGDYPSYAPGEIAVYCNTGFVLAGEIARRAGGIGAETFNDYMVRTLFQPLGMDRTNFRAALGDMAVGYIGGARIPAIEANCTFGATGGAVTTAIDMGRFLSMILNQGLGPDGNRMLTPQSVAMLGQSEITPLDLNSFFIPGLGLDTMDDPVMRYAGRAWAKNGSTGHFNSYMEMLPDMKLAVIVLTNSDTAHLSVYAIARECLKNAVTEKTGLQSSLPAYPSLPSEANPAVIAGTYVKKNGFDRLADNLDGTLSWTKDAHSGAPTVATLQYGASGWQEVPGATASLVFRNLSHMGMGHFAMIQVGSSGSALDESVFGGHVVLVQGEKLAIPAISPAWLGRVGLPWVVENIPFNDVNWDTPFLVIENAGGVLMVRQGVNLQVIFPSSDSLAFVQGMGNRNGSAVQVKTVSGRDTLVFVGYEAYPMNLVPVVLYGDVINASVAFHKTHWYRFDAAGPGSPVVFDIPGGTGGYHLRLFPSALSTAVAQGTDRISYTAPAGSHYLAVNRTPDAPAAYTLRVTP